MKIQNMFMKCLWKNSQRYIFLKIFYATFWKVMNNSRGILIRRTSARKSKWNNKNSIKESSWRHKVKIMLLELVRVRESGLGLELGFSEVT
jgi:PhoPQ-activated pathogenicity-related protein